jgi:hypothetical protein
VLGVVRQGLVGVLRSEAGSCLNYWGTLSKSLWVGQDTFAREMPSPINRFSSLPDIKVFIRNTQGKYLGQDANGLFFTDDRSAAVVLNYEGDEVPKQLAAIQKSQGVALTADPVPLDEIYETCDRCKELFIPFMTFFDGKSFLCADCRRATSNRRAQ